MILLRQNNEKEKIRVNDAITISKTYNTSLDFFAAEELLRHGLDQALPLSSKKKQGLRIRDMQLQYALCCVHENKLDDSETIL